MQTLQHQLSNIEAQIIKARAAKKALAKLSKMRVTNKTMFKREILENIVKGLQ